MCINTTKQLLITQTHSHLSPAQIRGVSRASARSSGFSGGFEAHVSRRTRAKINRDAASAHSPAERSHSTRLSSKTRLICDFELYVDMFLQSNTSNLR